MSHALIAVPFHGQSLLATLVDGIPHVAMKPICENIGLNWASQFSRIKRHPVMSKGIVMITTPSNGGIQEMLMLPLRMLNGWLFGVDSTRVAPEIKNRVIEYQEECFDVLANHFMPKTQYGLKHLPPSPYISEAEAHQFKKSMEEHCKGNGKSYALLYRKVYDYFGITTYKHIPTGKLTVAAVLAGIKLVPTKKPALPAEPMKLSFTPEELEDLVNERVKSIQGELVNESKNNTVTIELVPLKQGEMKRYMITHHGSDLVMNWAVNEASHRAYCLDVLIKADYFVIEKSKLEAIQKQLGIFLA